MIKRVITGNLFKYKIIGVVSRYFSMSKEEVKQPPKEGGGDDMIACKTPKVKQAVILGAESACQAGIPGEPCKFLPYDDF